MNTTLLSAKSTQTKSNRRGVTLVNPISRLVMATSLVAAVGVSVFTIASQPAFGIPNILTISTTGSDAGTCLVTPCRTLGFALSKALAGDTIDIDAGTYLESQNPAGTHNTVTAALSPLTIKSANGNPSNTIINAMDELNGIVVNANDVTVQGLTIENAGAEGILITPPTSATVPSSIVGATITNNVVNGDDQCIFTPKASFCPPPQPEDDYGESVHLESVANSTVSHNTVEHNVGGILLTDEVGPTHGNSISDNTVSDNAFDCGITLAGHSNKAVALGGPDFGQPQPSQAGVYGNTISGNVSDGNGAAGLLAAAATVGAGSYDNTFVGNTASGDGLAGVSIHLHAPFSDVNGNVVKNNTLSDDSLHGGPGGAVGDAEGPPTSANDDESTGVEVLAALAPVTGTVIEGNTISDVYYGAWISALASSTTVSGNSTNVFPGGTGVFNEPGPYSGYLMASSDGGTFGFGSAKFHGSAAGGQLGAPVTGVAPTPDGGGYWVVASNGAVGAFGDAVVHGSLSGKKLAAPIVGIAGTQNGGGYWLIGSDGGVFGFGDAKFDGSVPQVLKPGEHLAAPIVGIAATPDGGGYWLVGSDGGIFSFGDAPFAGSVPGALKGKKLNAPVVGIAASPGAINPSTGGFSGDGYWLVASDGGVFSFGDAKFFGSVPGALKAGQHLNAPIVGVAVGPGVVNLSTFTLDSDGYWLTGSDGGVFAFGDSGYFGSIPGVLKPGQHLVAPVVGIAGT